MQDKRTFPRLSTIWYIAYSKISAEDFQKDLLSSFTVNISGGGICFEAKEEIPDGTILAIELKSKFFPSTIIGLAKTVWHKKRKFRYDVGIEFLWTGWKDPNAQQALAGYIDEQIKK